MDLRDKIERLILGLGLSAARFADLIGVSRPLISHILSNRNKPSLELIQKIVSRFPELGYDWIGDHEMLNMDIVQSLSKNLDLSFSSNISDYSRESDILNETVPKSGILNSQPQENSTKNVIKVIIFYEDGTFQSFDKS